MLGSNKQIYQEKKDPTILQCCLNSSHQQPFIGVDTNCDKSAIFCIQHSSHTNDEGLIHQMMPLKTFKRTVHSKKFIMQQKIDYLLQSFNKFMDDLIQNIRELKLRKSIELSMLWLREISTNEDEYELMRQVYRMDFRDLTCRDIHSIYHKIIHNDALYQKEIKDISCYQGIMGILQDLTNNDKAHKIISQKITEIQGLLTNGKILQKVLPDKRILKPHIKQILLEEGLNNNYFNINYHKAELIKSSTKFYSIFSKYPIIPHVTYHIAFKTKYSNIMLGICHQSVKKISNQIDLHYSQHSIVYNCANGCVYKDGMFISGSCAEIKGLNQIVLKMRMTDNQIIIMTKDKVLMRSTFKKIIKGNTNGQNQLYMHILARSSGDHIQIQRDKEVTADNIGILNKIENLQPAQEQQQFYEDSIVSQALSSCIESSQQSRQRVAQPDYNKSTKIRSQQMENRNIQSSLEHLNLLRMNPPVLPSHGFLARSGDSHIDTDRIIQKKNNHKEQNSRFDDEQKMVVSSRFQKGNNIEENAEQENYSYRVRKPSVEDQFQQKKMQRNLSGLSFQSNQSHSFINQGSSSPKKNASLEQFRNKFLKNPKNNNLQPQVMGSKFSISPIFQIPERSQLSDGEARSSQKFLDLESSKKQQRQIKNSIKSGKPYYEYNDASKFEEIDVSEDNSFAYQLQVSRRKTIDEKQKMKKNDSQSQNDIKVSLVDSMSPATVQHLKIIKTPPRFGNLSKNFSDLSPRSNE